MRITVELLEDMGFTQLPTGNWVLSREDYSFEIHREGCYWIGGLATNQGSARRYLSTVLDLLVQVAQDAYSMAQAADLMKGG